MILNLINNECFIKHDEESDDEYISRIQISLGIKLQELTNNINILETQQITVKLPGVIHTKEVTVNVD